MPSIARRPLLTACAAAAATLLPLASAAAQTPELFRHQLQQSHLPLDQDKTRALAYGDVDGDGDIDVLVGNDASYDLQRPQVRLLRNDGRGALVDVTATQLPADFAGYQTTTSLALADLDGDGDLDLLLGKYSAQNRMYRNDGAGTFTDVTDTAMPVDVARTTAIAVGDTDGDGDIDVVIANSYPDGRQNFLYENDGAGAFVDVTAARLPALADATNDVALADFDGDGDLDLLTVNRGFFSLNRMLWNDGAGSFSLAGGPALPTQFQSSASVEVADLDGDQDLDFIVGNTINLPVHDGRDSVMINDGAGVFTDETDARLPNFLGNVYDVELRDVDGDSSPDLILATSDQNLLFVNDGNGAFSAAAVALPANDDASYAVVCFDVDGDGDGDLMFGNDYNGGPRQNRLYINEGGVGAFVDATLPRVPFVTAQGETSVLFDADGDRDNDLVVVFGYGGQQAARLFVNDGAGIFRPAAAGVFPVITGNARDIVAEDFDNDGDIDLVLAMLAGQTRYLTNDSFGRFVDETYRLPTADLWTEALAAADVDGDRDIDLVLGNQWGQDLLYLNDGTARFSDQTATWMPLENDSAGDLAFGDVDADGDMDLLVANEHSQNRLLENNGSSFTDVTATRMPTDADRSLSVSIGDVDGDFDLDVVFGNGNEQQNRLLLNDGFGGFTDATAAQLPAAFDSTAGTALGDVDGDGDLDLVTGNLHPTFENRLLRNDGSGAFTGEPLDAVLNNTWNVVLGDVDLDGDLDLVQSNNGEQLLLVNRQRQLTVPVMPAVGGTLHLDLDVLPGELQQPTIAVPFVSTARLTVAVPLLPFGELLIASADTTLPTLAPTLPGGVASTSLPIPPTSALAGVELFAQALILSSPNPDDWRLSNLAIATIRL